MYIVIRGKPLPIHKYQFLDNFCPLHYMEYVQLPIPIKPHQSYKHHSWEIGDEWKNTCMQRMKVEHCDILELEMMVET